MDRASYPLRLPTQLKNILAEKADNMGISLNALMVQIFWEYAEKLKEART